MQVQALLKGYAHAACTAVQYSSGASARK